MIDVTRKLRYHIDMPMLLPGLKAARERAQLTQEELAQRAGVSHATVYKHEQGRVEGIQGATIQKLADALGVETSALFLARNPEPSELVTS